MELENTLDILIGNDLKEISGIPRGKTIAINFANSDEQYEPVKYIISVALLLNENKIVLKLDGFEEELKIFYIWGSFWMLNLKLKDGKCRYNIDPPDMEFETINAVLKYVPTLKSTMRTGQDNFGFLLGVYKGVKIKDVLDTIRILRKNNIGLASGELLYIDKRRIPKPDIILEEE
jgi:hypothetical protein